MSMHPCATGGPKCTSIVRGWCHQFPDSVLRQMLCRAGPWSGAMSISVDELHSPPLMFCMALWETARLARSHGCWCTVQSSCACHGMSQKHAPESNTRECCRMLFCIDVASRYVHTFIVCNHRMSLPFLFSGRPGVLMHVLVLSSCHPGSMHVSVLPPCHPFSFPFCFDVHL